MEIKYSFKYFWTNFDPRNNFFVSFIEGCLRESGVEQVSGTLEVQLHSVFGRPRRLNSIKRKNLLLRAYVKKFIFRKAIILIWYSGELENPPKGYDLTLSYSPNLGNNYYLPVWVIYTTDNEFPKKYDRDFIFKWDDLLKNRKPRPLNDCRLACTFISNPSQSRLDFALELERMGILDIYGAAVGRPVKHKAEIAIDYIFQLCLENEDSENYITEKPFEAWFSGNIPVYRKSGGLSPLNKNSYVDILHDDPRFLAFELARIAEDSQRLDELYREPILNERLNLQGLEKAFIQLVSRALKEDRR